MSKIDALISAISTLNGTLTDMLTSVEQGDFDSMDSDEAQGVAAEVAQTITAAQGRTRSGRLHIQFRVSGEGGYRKADVAIPDSFHFPTGTLPSMAGTGSMYVPLVIDGNTLRYNGFSLLTVDGVANAAPTLAKAEPEPAPSVVESAQVAIRGDSAHIQFRMSGQSGYKTAEVSVAHLSQADRDAINEQATLKSLAGTNRRYAPLTVDGGKLMLNNVTIANLG